MAVRAVIFDWGGTLTPWHGIDHDALWLAVCSRHYPAGEAAAVAAAVRAAEVEHWRLCETSHRSATLDGVFARAGVTPSAGFLASYFEAWDPHTRTDPDVPPLLRELRRRGVKVGVLSNTMWPRAAHERIFGLFGPVRAVVRAHHARRGWRRRGRGMLLGGFFPMVAAGFFGAIALALTTLSAGGVGVPVPGGLAPRPGLVAADYPPVAVYLAVAACLTLAVGYAIRMARTPRRERRDQVGTFGRVLGED